MPVAGGVTAGVEASPLPDTASVPPGQILGAAGDCMPAGGSGTRKFDLPVGPLKKNSPASACGGQGLRRRLRRAFPFGGYNPNPLGPEKSSFGAHKILAEFRW